MSVNIPSPDDLLKALKKRCTPALIDCILTAIAEQIKKEFTGSNAIIFKLPEDLPDLAREEIIEQLRLARWTAKTLHTSTDLACELRITRQD